MTITATVTQVTGPAMSAGTQIGSQSIAAPANWTRLTSLGTIPDGGAMLRVSSDAEPFRVQIVRPEHTRNAGAPNRMPRDNGVLVAQFGAGSPGFVESLMHNAQVWVKRA